MPNAIIFISGQSRFSPTTRFSVVVVFPAPQILNAQRLWLSAMAEQRVNTLPECHERNLDNKKKCLVNGCDEAGRRSKSSSIVIFTQYYTTLMGLVFHCHIVYILE